MIVYLKKWLKKNWKFVCGVLSGIFIWILVKENILNLSYPAWGYLVFGGIEFATDDRVDFGDNAAFDGFGSAFTIVFNITRGSIGVDQAIGGKWDHLVSQRSWFVRIFADNTVQFNVDSDGAGVNVDARVTTSTITDSLPHQIACVWKSGQRNKIYFDGVEQAGTNAGSVQASINNSTASLFLGATSTGTLLNFNGTIIDAALYNTNLSTAQLLALWTEKNKQKSSTTEEANIVEVWPLDGEDGTSADGDTIRGSVNGLNGTGNDGANNVGLTWRAERVFSYPKPPQFIITTLAIGPEPEELDLINPQIENLKQSGVIKTLKEKYQIESLKQEGKIKWVQ